jgi:GT2 family glycosyltransferase
MPTALAAQTLERRAIVVDNHSPDDSAAALRDRFPEVGVILLGSAEVTTNPPTTAR